MVTTPFVDRDQQPVTTTVNHRFEEEEVRKIKKNKNKNKKRNKKKEENDDDNNNKKKRVRYNIPMPLQVDLLTLKVVSESRVTWATCVPILVFLDLSVPELFPMYATDRRQPYVRRQTKASLNAPAY